MDETKKASDWRKKETTQFLLRFVNASGIPEAIKRAAQQEQQAPVEYLKGVIIKELQNKKLLESDVVVNYNKARHKDKLQRLKEYIAAEEEKEKKGR